MQDIMIRIQAGDLEAWKQQRYRHAASRARDGITGGAAYRDLHDPARPCSPSASRTWTPPWAGSAATPQGSHQGGQDDRPQLLPRPPTDLTRRAGPGSSTSGHDTRQPGPRRHPPPA